MDVTSFHPAQRDWSATRAHRPPILTLWSETPGSAPTYAVGCLLFNGRLILDYAGNPIRAFRNLPLTISSAVKGFRLETWIRQDFRRLRVNDILARLRTRNTPNGRQPLQRRGDLTDRTNAFRLKSGLIPFRPYNSATRLGARTYIDSLRTAAQRASNLATDRDLTSNQLNTLKKLGKRGPVNAAAGSSATVSASASVNAPTITSSPIATITPTTATPTVATPTSVTPTIFTSISRPTRRRRRSPAPQPASSPLPTPTIDPTLPDSRDDVPETCKESYILQEALEETVEHFKKLTGQNPKHTNTAESYSSQWNALQMQFAPIWKTQRPREDTPFLFKLRAWIGGIKCWDSDWRTQVGGAKRDREGRSFGKHMDATTEGTAYLGRDGGWRSVRDTMCDSHVNPTEAHTGRRDSTSDDHSQEDAEEGSEKGSEQGSEEDTEGSSEEGSAEDSDDEFDDAQ